MYKDKVLLKLKIQITIVQIGLLAGHKTEFSRYYWIVEVHMTEFQAGFKNCALDGKGFTQKVLLY